jgi:hypothetical protein
VDLGIQESVQLTHLFNVSDIYNLSVDYTITHLEVLVALCCRFNCLLSGTIKVLCGKARAF